MSQTVDTQNKQAATGFTSTIYGPVQSWRYGWSLGVDLIRDTSTCSFNCIYCQLGDIVDKSNTRREFVSLETVMADLEASDWHKADIITLSGSGEPTLASNLGAVIRDLKAYTKKPVLVLTNATLLQDPDVIQDLCLADTVSVKLDAPNEATLQQMNRPVAGVTLAQIVAGIKAFKTVYTGKLSLQMMLMPTNIKAVDDLWTLVNELRPDELQLNTPKRPYPLSWHVESRGNHVPSPDYETRQLRTIEKEAAEAIAARFRAIEGLSVLSVYPE